jgi:carboxyl-terminal processing protease
MADRRRHFHDPAFGGLDWNAVRTELKPQAEAAGSPDDLRRVITDMLTRLKRSHFVLLSSSTTDADAGPVGQAMVPIEIRITPQGVLLTRVEPGSAAARAGLSAGQLLLSIDGTPVASWRSSGNDPAGRLRAFDLGAARIARCTATQARRGARGQPARWIEPPHHGNGAIEPEKS